MPQQEEMSQLRKSTRKKRQTQLSFTALPSSSPAASQYPDQIQQRAASVRYDDSMASPTKKRRVGGSTPIGSPSSRVSSNGGSPLKSRKVQVVLPSPSKIPDQLPTPAASSQVEMEKEPGKYILTLYLDPLLILICLSSFKTREEKPAA